MKTNDVSVVNSARNRKAKGTARNWPAGNDGGVLGVSSRYEPTPTSEPTYEDMIECVFGITPAGA